jgi:hypothetical protein
MSLVTPMFRGNFPEVGPLMPVSLTGPNPTLADSNVIFEALMQRTMVFERLLFSKVGSGRITAVIYIGDQVMNLEPFDAELLGSPNSFGVRLSLPLAEAGVKVRMQLQWHPFPWTAQMSPKEFARRKRTKDWTLAWEGHRLTIKPKQAKRRGIVADRLPELTIPDWHDSVQIYCTFLGRVIL